MTHLTPSAEVSATLDESRTALDAARAMSTKVLGEQLVAVLMTPDLLTMVERVSVIFEAVRRLELTEEVPS